MIIFFYISFLLILSCDDSLGNMQSLDYYCPVEDFQVNLYDCDSYDISWTYDIDSNTNCFENAYNFKIYTGQNSDQLVIELSVSPSIENLSEYYLDDNGAYHYITNDYEALGSLNYFSVVAVYDSDISSDNPIESLELSCGGPNVNISDIGCGDDYDSDCVLLNINHTSLGTSNIDGTLLYRVIENNGNQIHSSIIDTLSNNDQFEDKFYLDLCEIQNVVSIDGNFVMDLEKDYCNNILPNENYKLKYYYEIDGVSSAITEIENEIIFNRNNPSIISKPYSSNTSRIYVSDLLDLSYYNQILFYKADDSYNFSSPDYIINSPNLYNTHFESNNLFDIDNLLDDDYFILFIGDYSIEFSDNLYLLETLDDELQGFVLIENNNIVSNINSGNDFYINKFEITISESNQSYGNLPLESSCAEAELYISDLESQLNSSYSLSLPTTDEWEYVASYNIFTEESTLFPWGNEIDAYHANYLNSDLPSNSTGLVGVGLHPWPSAFGIYDMSGNVMEWTKEDNQCVGKGGNYLSTSNDLLIETDHSQIPESSSLGMGFRIIMK